MEIAMGHVHVQSICNWFWCLTANADQLKQLISWEVEIDLLGSWFSWSLLSGSWFHESWSRGRTPFIHIIIGKLQQSVAHQSNDQVWWFYQLGYSLGCGDHYNPIAIQLTKPCYMLLNFVLFVWPQRAEQALPRLQVLNPNVSVKADSERAEEKSDDYFTQFDVICATCCTTYTQVRNSPNFV